jgi:LacI family transcriptional regulator
VLVPLVGDLYFSGILAGVAEAVYEHERRLVLWPTLHQRGRELSLLERLKSGTDGALIVLPEGSSEELEWALSDRYPFVVVDPLLPLAPRIPTVVAAHASGAEEAMRHLLALGHRRIGAITGPPGWVATEDRRGAYHAALSAAGIQPDEQLIVASDYELAPGMDAAASLLDLSEPPTAIFGFNDAIAIGAMHAAHERGLRVPDDVSIVGFDDVGYASAVVPGLTTVRQPLAEMGRAGVSLLLRLIDRQRLEAPHIELPTRLVIRDSTGPPRTP